MIVLEEITQAQSPRTSTVRTIPGRVDLVVGFQPLTLPIQKHFATRHPSLSEGINPSIRIRLPAPPLLYQSTKPVPRCDKWSKSFYHAPPNGFRTSHIKMDQHDENNLRAAPALPKDGCAAGFNPEDSDQQEVSSILRGFKRDLTSCISLGKYGVLRNLNGDCEVLDAAGISPKFIKAFLDRMPSAYRNGFDGADGTKTPREQWFNPDKSLLPQPLTDEQKKAIEASQEENLKAHIEK